MASPDVQVCLDVPTVFLPFGVVNALTYITFLWEIGGYQGSVSSFLLDECSMLPADHVLWFKNVLGTLGTENTQYARDFDGSPAFAVQSFLTNMVNSGVLESPPEFRCQHKHTTSLIRAGADTSLSHWVSDLHGRLCILSPAACLYRHSLLCADEGFHRRKLMACRTTIA